MKTVPLWLAAGACSLLFFSTADLRADPGARAQRRGVRIPQKNEGSTARPAPVSRQSPRLPSFLNLGPGGRNSAGFSRFATAPQRVASACVSRCSDPRAPDRGMARASGVLAAMAAASVAAGVVVIVARNVKSERSGRTPELRLRVSGERAIAGVRWRF